MYFSSHFLILIFLLSTSVFWGCSSTNSSSDQSTLSSAEGGIQDQGHSNTQEEETQGGLSNSDEEKPLEMSPQGGHNMEDPDSQDGVCTPNSQEWDTHQADLNQFCNSWKTTYCSFAIVFMITYVI